MKDHEPIGNLLDQLSADAPVQRMRSRFEELVAESPEPRRSRAWLAWAAAAGVILIAGLLTLRLSSPAPGKSQPDARAILEMLAAPSTFERLRGVNAAAQLPQAWPVLSAPLLERLERDESLNVRLSALGVLLDHGLSPAESDRVVGALAAQGTPIVQAHVGFGLRRRQLVSRPELERILGQPEISGEAREALTRLEES